MDYSGINTAIEFICRDLPDIKSTYDFLKVFSTLSERITEEEETDFLDSPFYKLPLVRENGLSYINTYSFEIIDYDLMKPIKYKLMYIDTIHGPWIAIDLKDSNTTNQLGFLTNFMSKFIKLEEGLFKHKQAESYLKFVYYPELNKYFSIITNHLLLFKHPIYSWNKIIDHMNKS